MQEGVLYLILHEVLLKGCFDSLVFGLLNALRRVSRNPLLPLQFYKEMQKLFQEQRMYSLVTLMSEVVETVPIK